MGPSNSVRRFSFARGGASAVEFALVAPVFILVLVGIAVYGMYFGAALSVSQVAAEAARASVAGISPQERATLATSRALAVAQGSAFIQTDKLTVIAAPTPGDPSLFRVAVTYDASSLPIYAFAGLLPLPATTIQRTSVVARGGF